MVNRKRALFLVLFLSLYIMPLALAPAYVVAAEPWLDGFDYRRSVSITGSAGAGTSYDVLVNVTYEFRMQNDFDDIRFTDNDKTTELYYWRQNYTASSFALFWVSVADDLGSNRLIYMYFGNSTTSTTSNGLFVFSRFYDNTSISGWTTSSMTVTTSGDYLRFYNPTAASSGYAERFFATGSPQKFEVMMQLKTVSLGAVDRGLVMLIDGSISDRLAQLSMPRDDQIHIAYQTTNFGDWVEGTEYIVTVQVDETDSSTGIDYRQFNTAWVALDSALGKSFALGTPTDCDGIWIGDGSAVYNIDMYYRWIILRTRIDTEPAVSDFGDLEPTDWHLITEIDVGFVVIFSESLNWAINGYIIVIGLAMVPTSTVFLALSYKSKKLSLDRAFFGFLLFFLGWAIAFGVALG